MAKLIITRTSELNNRAREFGIYLNNIKIGTISNGDTKEFEIEPGIHKINAKIDWCKSQTTEFNIIENESKVIKIAGFKYGHWILKISLGVLGTYFLLKYLFEIELNFLIFLAAIGLAFPLYYITFGKNNYLRLKKLN
ncbi:MAG: hypothetical protein ACQEWG_02215 [Bacteroidota bacterium]